MVLTNFEFLYDPLGRLFEINSKDLSEFSSLLLPSCFSVDGWIDGLDTWADGQRDAYVAYIYIVIMAAVRYSETSIQLIQTSRRNILECRPFTVVWCRRAVMLEVLSNELVLVECRLIR
jgi:hypothetical protein